MTSPYPTPPFTGPSPSDSSFSIPTTSEPVFSMATTEPVFQAQTSSSAQPSQNPQPQFQQYNSTTVSSSNAKFPYRKWTGRDPRGNIMILPPVTMEEQIAVQRETKARTILLQSLPEDHMADFHHLDDAKDIWLAVKARFGGNEESKKMRKFQKVLSQLNQMQARPDNEDCNMKFLRALPPSWSQCSHSTNSKWSTADSKGQPSTVSYTTTSSSADASGNVIENVLHSFVAESDPQQQITYEDFDQIGKLDLEELDIKWQWAIAYLVESIDLKRSCRKFKERRGFKIRLNWSDLNESDDMEKAVDAARWIRTDVIFATVVFVVLVMIQMVDATDAETQFALCVIPQAKIDKVNTQVKLEESNTRFDKWKESSKNLVKLINSSMTSRSKFGLGYGDTFGSDEVFDLSAPSIFDSCLKDAKEKPLYDWFVKPVGMHVVPPPITGTFMPPSNKPDIDDTQFTYGSKSNHYSESNSVSNDFVSCETSDKSSDSETTGFASCASSVNSSSTMTNASSSVDLKTLHKTDDQGPCNVTQSPSFSFKENVKTPRNLCNRNGSNNISLCKNKSFGGKKCFVCGSKFHLIRDCDFIEIHGLNNAPVGKNGRKHSSFVPRPAYVPAGSRNRPTSVPAGRPFPAGWHNPAAKPMTRPKSHYFQQFSRPGSYNQMDMDGGRWRTAVKTSAGCSWQSNMPYMHWGSKNNGGSQQSTGFFPLLIHKAWRQDNPHTNKDLGIVDSGCSRSMTGNKEKLADFVKIKGGTVTFGGGDGKITGKGTIRTSNFNFENVYYVEELQNFNLFSVSQICDTKNKVLFTDKECLVLSKEFQPPDSSQVCSSEFQGDNNLYAINLT
ncbi:hypothetical protein Tco_1135268 [Tanacetum coccineum]